MKLYSGLLGKHRMSGDAQVGYNVWSHQKERCNRVKHKSYKFYGAKGIRVEYSSREFVTWYLEQIKKFKGDKPSVGRIDHSKNYSLDNIEMVTCSENSKEMIRRCGAPDKRKFIEISKNQKIIAIVLGLSKASEVTGISPSQICGLIKGYCKRSYTGYKFQYKEALQ